MKWCSSCVLPDTRPNLRIESDGRCNACHAHNTKKDIDWKKREKEFLNAIEHAKSRAEGYDCVIPVSGGKDSTWQTIKCLDYGLKPLAITWKTPGRTNIGQKNLDNLISLGVDHIDYQINPHTESKFMLKTFKKFGSTGVPMHLALFNIPLMIATRFNIPLIVWGENSAFEYGSADEAHTGLTLDEEWLKNYGVTHGTTAEDWVDSELTRKDLSAYIRPKKTEIEKTKVKAVFLGYYLQWDPEETKRIAQQNGFQTNAGQARTGYYDYADIDDDFISLHHWMKWYKFGFTRTFDNLSLEIRNNRITREEAIEVLNDEGIKVPERDIEKFCKFSKITKNNFFDIAEKFRNKEIWKQKIDGTWWIPEFLFPVENWA